MNKQKLPHLAQVLPLVILIGIFAFLLATCSSPREKAENRANSLVKGLTGHWVSIDGKEHLYFSENRRILLISDGKTFWNSQYDYSFFVPTQKTDPDDAKKFRNVLFIDFNIDFVSGSYPMCQVIKFSDDRREMCLMSCSSYDLAPLIVGSPDNYRYSDSSQSP